MRLIIFLFCMATAANAGNSSLFYFQGGTTTSCLWNLTRFPEKKTLTLTKTDQCPTALLFDFKERASYFYVHKQVYKIAWKKGATPEALPKLPKIVETPADYYESMHTVQLMREETSGNLIIQKLVPLTELSSDGKHFIFDKMRFPKNEFSVGSPYAAIQLSLHHQAWEIGPIKATTSEACDTLGLGVFDWKSAPHSLSLTQLSLEGNCLLAQNNSCQIDATLKKNLALERWAKGLEIGYIPLSQNKTGIAFEIGNCDGKVCFGGKAFYCTNDCSEQKPISILVDQKPEQIIGGYHVSGDYLLASGIHDQKSKPYTGAIARVYKMPQLTPIFEIQTDTAYWITAPELWMTHQ